MIDISSFVLRWMFLSNLCRDIIDIQTLPAIHQAAQLLPPPSQPPTIQPTTNIHHQGSSSKNDDDYHPQQSQPQVPHYFTESQNHLSPQTLLPPNVVVDYPTAHNPEVRMKSSPLPYPAVLDGPIPIPLTSEMESRAWITAS